MPQDAVYVGRPTVWGNPFHLELLRAAGRWRIWPCLDERFDLCGLFDTKPEAARAAVTAYAAWVVVSVNRPQTFVCCCPVPLIVR
jgi:hypothetical protein